MRASIRKIFGILTLAACFAGVVVLHYLHWPARQVAQSPTPNVLRQASQAAPEPFATDASVTAPFPSPNAAATDEELLELARSVINRSPQAAIEWARSQSDPALGRRLLSAVIHAWAENAPNAAVDWVLAQDPGERQADMDAAMLGAVRHPEMAVAIVSGLLKYYDASDTAGAGPALILALNNAGQFQTALDFINGGPQDQRAEWTRTTFQRWGESQPQEAIQALDSVSDGTLRESAFRALVDGWSAGNPSTLADYTASLPDGADRSYALEKVVANWSFEDPSAMAQWLLTFPRGSDFDQAVATLISKTDGANRSPEIAMQWVENITDPTLKFQSFQSVLKEWNQTNPSAAQSYAANASWLDDQQRKQILAGLQNSVE